MAVIVAINPTKRRKNTKSVARPTTKKKGDTMPKKKSKRRSPATKTIVRYKYRTRKNPTKRRAVANYAKSTIGGVNIQGALKSTVPLLLGALAAKFAAKKFSDGAGEGEDWTWKSYGLAALGGLVAAVGTSAIFKTNRNTSQKVLEGALLLIGYKIFINEIASQNETMNQWFSGYSAYGQADEFGQDFDPYAGYDEGVGNGGLGDVWQGDEADYVQGTDGHWRPVDESHRVNGLSDGIQPAGGGMGSLLPAGGNMGDDIEEFSKEFENAY